MYMCLYIHMDVDMAPISMVEGSPLPPSVYVRPACPPPRSCRSPPGTLVSPPAYKDMRLGRFRSPDQTSALLCVSVSGDGLSALLPLLFRRILGIAPGLPRSCTG